jgi:nitrate/TMAO reductase-like tetraheme cytochrome c subunit
MLYEGCWFMVLRSKRHAGSILLGTLVLIAVACGVYFGFQKFVEYCNRDETITATAQMQQARRRYKEPRQYQSGD